MVQIGNFKMNFYVTVSVNNRFVYIFTSTAFMAPDKEAFVWMFIVVVTAVYVNKSLSFGS